MFQDITDSLVSFCKIELSGYVSAKLLNILPMHK